MFVQLVHITVKPGRVEEFIEAFRINFEGTCREPGNVRFDVLQERDNPEKFVIYEVFESAEAVEAHRQTEHYEKTVELLKDLTEGPRDKDFMNLVMKSEQSPATV